MSANGGHARARSLSPARRKEIAQIAAHARWHAPKEPNAMRNAPKAAKQTAGFLLSADDGDTTIHVRVNIAFDDQHLVPLDVETLRITAIRAIAKALESLPYTDFGIDNIKLHP